MIIRRIGVASLVRILGTIYALLGLLFGALLSLFSIAGCAFVPDDEGQVVALLFGIGAIVVLPIFYGIIGLIAGFVVGNVYNAAARLMGGLELEVDRDA